MPIVYDNKTFKSSKLVAEGAVTVRDTYASYLDKVDRSIKPEDYDFHNWVKAIELIKEYYLDPLVKNQLRDGLNLLKNEINKFFKDSTCSDIIYTNNTDKMFFGMYVYPIINSSDAYRTIVGDDKFRIEKYIIEIDSKLFYPGLELNEDEIVAILLHEIGHMVNDSSPIDNLRKNYTVFTARTSRVIKQTQNVNYRELLLYGAKDALRKMNSIFEKKDDEVLADEFVIRYGYGHQLESALTKIVRNSHTINRDVDDKFIVLTWAINLYNDIKHRRIPALRVINRMKDLTPSYLERKEIENIETRIKRIDDEAMLESAPLTLNEGGLFTSLKRTGIRGYENDLYELTMQARNVEREEDALLIMSRINSRMNIIDDYITSDNPPDFKRWNDLYMKYEKLRSTLANKQVYRDDHNRIYVNYPTIKDNR